MCFEDDELTDCKKVMTQLLRGIPMRTRGDSTELLIAEGTFATLWRSKDGLRALKKSDLPPPKAGSITPVGCLQWKTFLTEVAVLRKVSHPKIVHYIEAYRTHSHGYISMKWVEGKTLLSHLMDSTSPLRNVSFFVTYVLCPLTEVLLHLHHLGIAHRDIRLENVMFDETINEVKLIDFGSAFVDNTQNRAEEVKIPCSESDNVASGSPLFLSSERVNQALGFGKTFLSLEEYSQADIYALGILTYIALYGTHPYFVHRAGFPYVSS